MEVDFEVTKSDLSAINRSVTRAVWAEPANRKAKLILQFANIIFWIPAGCFIAYSNIHHGSYIAKFAALGVLIGFGIKWLYGSLERFVIQSLPQKEGPTLGPHKIIADETGVSVSTSNYKSSTSWSGIRTIIQSGNFILLFIDVHLAYYIPTRALPPKSSPQSVIDELHRFKNASPNQPTEPTR